MPPGLRWPGVCEYQDGTEQTLHPTRPVAQLTSMYFAIWAIVAERTPGRPRVPLPTMWH